MSAKVTDKRVRELLPFRANGTLSDAESREVDTALATDPALAAELEVFRSLRAGVRSAGLDDVRSPGAFGLARLEKALATEERHGFERRRLWVGLAAASVVAVGLIVTYERRELAADAPAYLQASGPDTGMSVIFQPAATAAEIATVLQENGLHITDGPSALGLYHLATEPGADTDRIVKALAAARGVVQSASPAE